MSAVIEPLYRSVTYDGRAVTGLKHAEIADRRDGGVSFYPTPSAGVAWPVRAPRRARMRGGIVQHVDRHGYVREYRIVEAIRVSGYGASGTRYDWRAASAVETGA